jgi:hypothetical protein
MRTGYIAGLAMPLTPPTGMVVVATFAANAAGSAAGYDHPSPPNACNASCLQLAKHCNGANDPSLPVQRCKTFVAPLDKIVIGSG